MAPARPGRATSVFMVLIWIVSLLAFLVDSITYGFVLERANLVAVYQSYTAPNPITPVTEAGAAATFVIIVLLTRRHGLKVALPSAFVGAASAPMVFELPFDLIVLDRIYPPIPLHRFSSGCSSSCPCFLWSSRPCLSSPSRP